MPLTPDQKRARKGRITGSRIGAIAGLNPWSSPLDVWQEMMGLIDVEETEEMRWGSDLEPAILARYEDDIGTELTQVGTITRDGWAAGTPDGTLPSKRRIAEAKTAGWRQAKEWTDETIPGYHLAQVHWYMWLLDYESADVAVLIAGQDYRVYRFEHSLSLERELVRIGREFYERHVLTQEPPPVDGSDSARRFLARRYPQDTGMVVKATPEINQCIAYLQQARQIQAWATQERQRSENIIKSYLGSATGLESRHGPISWRRSKDGSQTDWEALAREMGATEEQIARHTKPKEGARVFRVPKEWGGR